MTENGNRWDVGNNLGKWQSWNYAHEFLVDATSTKMYREDYLMDPGWAHETIGFIIELVHEIERLEGENIRQRDYIDAVNLRTAFRRTSMAVDSHTSPVQPFHMEPE